MKSRNPHHEHEQRLERLTHEALRRLPQCRAPDSLEARVLREIEQRAAAPDGATGIARGLRIGRALLIAVCALCVPLVWMLVTHLRGPVAHALTHSGVGEVINGVRGTGHTVFALGELATRLAQMIPKDWLLGGLFITSTVYAVLVALGYLLLHSTLTNFKGHSA